MNDEAQPKKAYTEQVTEQKGRLIGENAGRLVGWSQEHPGAIFMMLTFGPIITLVCVLSVFIPGWAVGLIATVLGTFAGWFCCVNFNATFLVAQDRVKSLERKLASSEQALRTGAEAFKKEQDRNNALEARLRMPITTLLNVEAEKAVKVASTPKARPKPRKRAPALQYSVDKEPKGKCRPKAKEVAEKYAENT